MEDDFDLLRSVATWTAVAVVALAAMIWALAGQGLLAGLSFTVGWVALLVFSIGLFRKAPLGARLWPLVIAIGLVVFWATYERLFKGDLDALELAVFVLVALAAFVFVAASGIFLTRRGWIVDSPLRRKLSGAVTLAMAFVTTIGVPAGVWRARVALGALIVLTAIHFWPSSKASDPRDAAGVTSV